jgi:hypothetical protein
MIELTKALRRALPSTLISHAPQTPYVTLGMDEHNMHVDLNTPGFWGSYLPIMAQVGHEIDFLNIQAYNNSPAQYCPVGAAIVNNLGKDTALPRIYGGGVMPAIRADKLQYGMLIEKGHLDQPAAGDKINTSPGDHPWCRGTPVVMNDKVGNMFWLDYPGSYTIADGVIDTWYGPPSAQKQLSPPNRVVYYTNDPASFKPPLTGYSRANTVILGFIYPKDNTGSISVASVTGADVIPNPAGVPDWALFGLHDTAYPGYIETLKTWRASEPGKRKVMVSVGGAFAVPDYKKWSEGDNVIQVAKGLKQFAEQWEKAFGFPLDGIDIDFEDSNALAIHRTKLPPSPLMMSNVQGVVEAAVGTECAKWGGRAVLPYAIVMVVVTALILVGIIAAACVPRVRTEVLSKTRYLGPFVTTAILAMIGLIAGAGLLSRAGDATKPLV